ncbi:MAG: HAD hydrolase family protein [Clostridia bacterium]|nr:HAD hydrolase family protein [Clostridia bacterium]
MKIAIYGVSRAGKDYLIGNAVNKVPQLYHLRGSETLKRLSQEKLGKPFAETDEDEKNVLRVAFTEEAAATEKKYGNIVIDGHYAFPDDNGGYRIAFTEADRTLYDVFIYLKPKTERILENQKHLKDGKPVRQFTASEIEAWEEFEIAEMQKVCRGLDKELIVLDGDIPVCAEFIKDIVAAPEMCEPRKLVKDMLKDFAGLTDKSGTVVVTDCDKTLSMKDTGDSFGEYVGLEGKALKEIFRGDYYSIYQFYKWKKLYEKYVDAGTFGGACAFAVSDARINQKLVADVSKRECLTVGITTGLTEIWQPIAHGAGFPQLLFGNTMGKTPLIVSATTKRMLVEELQKAGKTVIALGDGTLDMPMLEAADKGYVIAEAKLSKSVAKYLADKKPDIKQLSYSKFKYDGLGVANSIWE